MIRALLALATAGAAAAAIPTHGWDTALESQFIDFGYSCRAPENCVGITPFTQARAEALVSKYAIVSLEKCTGARDTEEAIWASARLLKSLKPTLKVFFYLATDLGGLSCYSAYHFYMNQTAWHLRNDAGQVVNISAGSDIPLLDYTVAEARDWWASLPLNGTTQYADLIDGVLADGSGSPCPLPGISAARCLALAAGKAAMVAQLQATLTAANGGVVLQNLITLYGNEPNDGLDWLQYSNGVMGEHFAVFEDVLPSGRLNATRVAEFLADIGTAAAAGKLVVMGTWPGLCTTPFAADGYPSWPGGTQPNTTLGWQAALLDKHAFALAGFLTVAEANVFQQYEGWYENHQGAVPCPEDPSSCASPPNWYPDLSKPLGAPLGPAVRAGNTFTRHFQHATSYLDLDQPEASGVTFF
jgi:hypothetical protein